MNSNRVSLTLNDYGADQRHGQGIRPLGDALPRVLASYGVMVCRRQQKTERLGAARPFAKMSMCGSSDALLDRKEVGRSRTNTTTETCIRVFP